MKEWIELALSCGFTHAVPIAPEKLQPMEAVRDMCRADKCRAYGKNWTCPPACGTLDQCAGVLHSYRRGLLLQTVGALSKAIDTRGYAAAEQAHREAMAAFAREIRKAFPDALCLGAGGCRVCKECAYPDPCRFPEKAISSMEAYGLFVTQVCRDHELPYHYGSGTITYCGCVLF